MTETLAALVAAHRAGTTTPVATVARSYARLRAHNDPAVFISVRAEVDAIAEAEAVAAKDPASLPLYGVPIAVKDNIDVEGLPTTAGCPAFGYMPAADAPVVARLRRAGAIIIGKTNLDQFATGLVGVRSPYGLPRNPFSPELIPGGSSSGSAVAVAAGIVPAALGTDTAGSGRIPAGLNNIVGLKPTPGLVPSTGIVPACRSLDCVSVMALTTDDVLAVLAVIAGPDATDPYSRVLPLGALGALPPRLRAGVPQPSDRLFFGDARAAAAYDQALQRMSALGVRLVDIEMAPFFATGRLLYEGPWLAERAAAVGDFIARHRDDVHPVTRAIISGGENISAKEAFRAFHRLAALTLEARDSWQTMDVLMVPTVPALYSVAQIEADPVRLNGHLGTYSNFANLLGLAGLAVPAMIAADGTPHGVTLLAPAGEDMLIANLGRRFHAHSGLPLGALGVPQPVLEELQTMAAPGEVAFAVPEAQLAGSVLDAELHLLHARFLQQTRTRPDYRVLAVAASPPKQALQRIAAGTGDAVGCEIWALTAEAFGRFVAALQPPMSIGTVVLADGGAVKGLLVESEARAHAPGIGGFGAVMPVRTGE